MKRLLRVLDGEPLSPPPVWLMRQAGRYLPEYRETRARAGSFLDLCYNPELAEEVTLQPIRRYGFDAAILFADILLVPHALGQHLEFVQGEGPRLAPITERAGLDALKDVDRIDETLSPVYETVGRLSRSLPAETTLIGFAGAPWTVATYMIAGRGTPDQAPAHALMRDAPAVFEAMMEIVTEATIHYLSRQVSAGAEVVKVFDSWAGSLEGDAFVRHALGPARRIAETLKARHPGLKVIGFPRGAGDLYPRFAAETGVDCVALDTNVDLAWARREMPATPLQGNLDPQLMITGGSALEDAAKRAVATMEDHPYVVNLGHGITPEADPENVHVLLKAIRG